MMHKIVFRVVANEVRRRMGAGNRKKALAMAVFALFCLYTVMAATVLAADNGGTGGKKGENVIPNYTNKLKNVVENLKGLGYVVGLGLMIAGAIWYGISALSSSVDQSQAIQGRTTGMHMVLVGLVIVAICAFAEDAACAVAKFFGGQPSFC